MNQTSNIWSIDVDEATGRAKGEPVALTDDAGTRATVPIVSVSHSGGEGDRLLPASAAKPIASPPWHCYQILAPEHGFEP